MEYLDRIIKRHLQQKVQKTLTRINEQAKNQKKSLKNFKSAEIAKQLYNAKGFFKDDEDAAIRAIERIRTVQQYNEVNKQLQPLTGQKGIGQWLRSFMPFNKRLEIVNHLTTAIPKKQWHWTISAIMPWEDFKRVTTGGSAYEKGQMPGSKTGYTAGQNNAITDLIGYYSDEWQTRGEELGREFVHDMMTTLGIVTAPILPLSAAIGLIDAELYRREANNYAAGLIATFSLLPGMGSAVARRLPAVMKLGKTGMTNLGKKIARGSKKLTSTQSQAVAEVKKNSGFIRRSLDNFLDKQIKANSGKIKALPDAAKKSLNSKLTNAAKAGFKFAGTAGFYLYGVPAAYGAVYNKLDPPVTQQDINSILIPAEERIGKLAMASLQRMLAKRSTANTKKYGGSKSQTKSGVGQPVLTGFQKMGAAVGKTIGKQQESKQPLKEFNPAPEAPGLLSQIGDMISIGGIGNMAWIGLAIGVIAGIGGNRLYRKFTGKTKSRAANPRSLPFHKWRMFQKVPKLFTTDYWRALRDIKNLNNVRIPDAVELGGFKTINVTRSQYNATVARLEEFTTSQLREFEKELTEQLASGKITPEQAVIDLAAIAPGKFTSKFEAYVKTWKTGETNRIAQMKAAAEKEAAEKAAAANRKVTMDPYGTSYGYSTTTTLGKGKSTSGTASAAKPPMGWAYPNVTPEQFKTLNISDKTYLALNPSARYNPATKSIKRSY
jgi:hypothetical protein